MATESSFTGEDRDLPGTYTNRGAVVYVETFLANLRLHEVRRGDPCFPIELIAEGLDDEAKELLR